MQRNKLNLVDRLSNKKPDQKGRMSLTKRMEIQKKIIDEDCDDDMDKKSQSKKETDKTSSKSKPSKPKKDDGDDKKITGKSKPTQLILNPDDGSNDVGRPVAESDVNIQYQTAAGNWITARRSSDKSNDVLQGMKSVKRTYPGRRIRAVDKKGNIVDMLKEDILTQEEIARLDELVGKGKLPDIRSHHEKKLSQYADKVDRAERRRDYDAADDAMHAGMEHQHKAERAAALTKRANAATALRSAKAAHEKAKKQSNDYNDKHMYQPQKAASKASKEMDKWKGVRKEEILSPEEVDRLDELSQKTMRHYAVKSAEQQVKINDKSIHLGNDNPKGKNDEKLGKLQHKFDKRYRGLNLANKKLKGKVQPKFDHVEYEDGNQLDEIGKEKLSRYLERATRDHGMASFAARMTNRPDEKKYYERKTRNLKKGVSRAIDRLDKIKEGVDQGVKSLDETTIDTKLKGVTEMKRVGLQAGDEKTEPKFSGHIQTAAGKAMGGTVVQFTHQDGSKTTIDRKMAQKITGAIASAENSKRAALVGKFHSSAKALGESLEERATPYLPDGYDDNFSIRKIYQKPISETAGHRPLEKNGESTHMRVNAALRKAGYYDTYKEAKFVGHSKSGHEIHKVFFKDDDGKRVHGHVYIDKQGNGEY